MSELLPCPFCGHATPAFERLGTPRQSCIVICGDCGCRHESADEGSGNGSSWNHRAPNAPQVAQGDERVWRLEVAGPGGYVRFEKFEGATLDDARKNAMRQGFICCQDGDDQDIAQGDERAVNLPPCPKALVIVDAMPRFMWSEMQDYARAAVTADRLSRQPSAGDAKDAGRMQFLFKHFQSYIGSTLLHDWLVHNLLRFGGLGEAIDAAREKYDAALAARGKK